MDRKDTAFILCLFLGILGVHKFYERKIGMGILYLLTGGLFGIGWLVDIIIYICEKSSMSRLAKILILLLVFFIIIPLFSGCSDSASTTEEENPVVEVIEDEGESQVSEDEVVIEEEVEEEPSQPEEPKEVLPGVGETVSTKKFDLTVNEFYESNIIEGNMFTDSMSSSGKFIIVEVVIKNNENSSTNYSYYDLELVSGDTRFSALDSLEMTLIYDDYLWFEDVNPGLSTTNIVVFEVPSDLEHYNLEMGLFNKAVIELQ